MDGDRNKSWWRPMAVTPWSVVLFTKILIIDLDIKRKRTILYFFHVNSYENSVVTQDSSKPLVSVKKSGHYLS